MENVEGLVNYLEKLRKFFTQSSIIARTSMLRWAKQEVQNILTVQPRIRLATINVYSFWTLFSMSTTQAELYKKVLSHSSFEAFDKRAEFSS